MCIGAAIQTCSFSLAQIIVGRIVTGFGNGMNTSAIRMFGCIALGWMALLTFFSQLYGSLRWRLRRLEDS